MKKSDARKVELSRFLPSPMAELFPFDVTAPVVNPKDILEEILPWMLGHCEGLAWTCHWSLLCQGGEPDKVRQALEGLAEQLTFMKRLFELCQSPGAGNAGEAAACDEGRASP